MKTEIGYIMRIVKGSGVKLNLIRMVIGYIMKPVRVI
jgi:hypothetical protein